MEDPATPKSAEPRATAAHIVRRPARTSIPRLPLHATWPPSSPRSSIAVSLVPRACRVPQCPNRHCTLTSHRLYDPHPLRRQSQSTSKSADRVVPRSPGPEIGRGGVDPLPKLPIDDGLDPALRALFHHFFDAVFDRLAGIFRGPLRTPGYKDRMLGVALANNAYCMGLITQAQTDMAIARGTFAETRESLELYTKLIGIFRAQLAASVGRDGRPDPMRIEIALLILCILLSYNVTRGRLAEIRMNWGAMQHLVQLRGGVHYLTVALAYVVHVDRLCATMLGLLPTYVSACDIVHRFDRPPWSQYSPGFVRLETSRSHRVTEPVLAHALNTCELLSLHDALYSPAPPAQKHAATSPASPEYLYYIRDKVDEQFAILYAELLHDNSRSRCVLLANRIVEYPVTWANYVPSITIDLCAELASLLRCQDLLELWSGAFDVLTWALLVMLTSQWPFDGRDWVTDCFRSIIGAKYGAAGWPDDWWAEELANVRSFAWSDLHYTKRLDQVWRELERGAHASESVAALKKEPGQAVLGEAG